MTARLEQLQEQLISLDIKRIALCSEIHLIKREIESEQFKVIALDPSEYDIGDWACDSSPIGICVYHIDDTCQDDCIYCHDPDERK